MSTDPPAVDEDLVGVVRRLDEYLARSPLPCFRDIHPAPVPERAVSGRVLPEVGNFDGFPILSTEGRGGDCETRESRAEENDDVRGSKHRDRFS